MHDSGRRFNPAQFPGDILPLGGESPKAENLLITKGKFLRFSLPKAENILKTNQLANCKMTFRPFLFEKLITC